MTVRADAPIPGIDDIHYAQDLAAGACPCGECDGYQFRSSCCPDAGVHVSYRRSANVLVMHCRGCDSFVQTIAVGKRVTH